MYYTYAHYTADTKELFYIGKGTEASSFKHKRAFSNQGRNRYWKNTVAKHGGFLVEILACWEKEYEAFEHEKLLILCFKNKVVNLTEGGEGCHGREQTIEEKEKRATSLRGLKRTYTALKNMSEAQKKNKKAKDTLDASRQKQKKRVLCVTTKVEYSSLSEASDKTGVSFQNISKCCLGKRASAGGLLWVYLND